MKKIFFIAATVLGIANLSAQEKKSEGQFGFTTTANMSSYNGKDVSNADYALGFTAGLYANFPLTEGFSIQPEVNFARLAGRTTKDITTSTITGSERVSSINKKNYRTLDYIQIPIMFKYFVGGSRFNIQVGPQVGFNIYASEKTVTTLVANNIVTNTEVKKDIKDDIQKFDFGANFGLGYHITDHVNLNARYYMGLTKIVKGHDGTEDKNVKNHSFTFGVGYLF